MASTDYLRASQVAGFKRDPNLVKQHTVNQKAGVVDSYRHLSPVVDTDHYMYWLRDTVSQKGATLVTGRISGDLLAQEDALLEQYDAVAIVNATGLSAVELAGDETVYPLRGALIRVVNDGKRFPKVTEALAVGIDDAHKGEQELVFIVPRNDKILILGGKSRTITRSSHCHSDTCLQASRSLASGTSISTSRARRSCACGSAATTSCPGSKTRSTTPTRRSCRVTVRRGPRTYALSGRCV